MARPTEPTSAPDWLLWQLVDSAFPTGGFAHSGGVESVWQHGMMRDGDDLLALAEAAVRQAAYGTVPAALAVLREPTTFADVDAFYDATVTNHVANRASRAQGRALLATAAGAFDRVELKTALDQARRAELACHLPTAFGLTAAALGLSGLAAASAVLFVTARGMISAAVRLGAVGPLEGQRVEARVAASTAGLDRAAVARPLSAVTQTAPVLDLLQSAQDRLYSRLFQS